MKFHVWNKMPSSDDIERLRGEYQRRDRSASTGVKYASLNPVQLFTLQSRQRHMQSLFQKVGILSLEGLRILDLGCGYGDSTLGLLHSGASPEMLHGCDLIFYRLSGLKNKSIHLPVTNADGQNLPFPEGFFNIILQSTLFSSILDSRVKMKIADEIKRVLKPDGYVLWYDFWWNPSNKNARGIRPSEVRRLFPGYKTIFRRVTLAPPITRRLVSISWSACTILESLKLFNSHYLGVIFQQQDRTISTDRNSHNKL
jgi:ubiquinone/menaquinone biosynthesis C-methylase UbiE